jgi:hypothetical protein
MQCKDVSSPTVRTDSVLKTAVKSPKRIVTLLHVIRVHTNRHSSDRFRRNSNDYENPRKARGYSV